MNESSNELVIDPELLVDIQCRCRERAAELEAAAVPPRLPGAPERPQSVFAMAEVPPPISQAERFAAAVEEMPGNVRRFFEREEPVPAWRTKSGKVTRSVGKAEEVLLGQNFMGRPVPRSTDPGTPLDRG